MTQPTFPGPDPYAPLTPLPTFELTSTDVAEGEKLPDPQTAAGGSHSPQLSWSGAPADTGYYAVTCFDPDAPTASGYWHWAVFNIPASVTELPTGLTTLPEGAVSLKGDSGQREYYGAAAPAGHGPHRYIFAVHSYPDALEIDPDATPTVLGFHLNFQATGRALLTTWWEHPDQG